MKKSIILLSFFALIFSACDRNLYGVKPDEGGENSTTLEKTAFTRGVNLSGCFDVTPSADAGSIWMGTITEDSFTNLQSLGVDVVRVPMNIGRFDISGAPDYTLDPRFFARLDELLDLGEQFGITVIIDNHQWGLTETYTEDRATGFMKSSWRQIAEHCKSRTSRVVYELKNEPDGQWWSDHWHELQGELIGEIRKVDDVHDIIVCPAPGSSFEQMPEYEDEKLIYTSHFYGPMVFTHQGSSWNVYKPLGGKIPFPYNKSFDIQATVAIDGLTEEVKDEIRNYPYTGTEAAIQTSLDRVIAEAKRRKVRLFVGEFGVMSFSGAKKEDICYWHEVVRKHLENNGVSWTVWAYADRDFCMFNVPGAPPKFHTDLNLDLVKALGFDIPPAYDDSPVDKSSFVTRVLYDDAWGEGIIPESDQKTYLTFPYTNDYASGENCIKFDINSQWLDCSFCFDGLCEDLEKFDIKRSYIRFKLKTACEPDNFRIAVWFVDNKEKFSDEQERHNWVIKYDVTKSDFTPDGEWHEVSLPLKYFGYRGSEDPPYSYSENHFTWSKIREIRITNEDFSSMNGVTLLIDDVILTGPENKYWKPSDPNPNPDPDPNPDPNPNPDPDPTPGPVDDAQGSIDDFEVLPQY